jgi:hypothetical protein
MTAVKFWDAAAGQWVMIGAVQGPQGPQGAQGIQGIQGVAGPPTLETWVGPSAPSPRGDYTVWIDTDDSEVVPIPDTLNLGYARWNTASNHGAATAAWYAWATPDGLNDASVYVLDAVSGKVTGTMVRVLQSGWYRVRGQMLTGPGTAGSRADVYLNKLASDKATATPMDLSLQANSADGYASHSLMAEMKLAVGEGFGVNNVNGVVYGTTPWAHLEVRRIGTY